MSRGGPRHEATIANRIGPMQSQAHAVASRATSWAFCIFRAPSEFSDILYFMYAVEVEQEEDGRWIAEVPDLPGVLTYGQSREEAVRKAQALSLRVLADRLEHGESFPHAETVFSIVA